MTGAVGATAPGLGFGVFQTLNRRALIGVYPYAAAGAALVVAGSLLLAVAA